MAWLPIEGLVPQSTIDGNQANGMVLKFYEPGTLTPLAVATDNTGATQTTEFLLDTQGYTTLSAAIVIPHADTIYRVVLYLNQTDADVNNTAASVYDIDDVDSVGSLSILVEEIDNIINGIPLEFDNMAAALTDVNEVVSEGSFITINENIAGSGVGRASYQAVTVNPGFNLVNPLMANATLYLKLQVEGDINLSKAAIIADDSTDFTANFQQVNDYAFSKGVGLLIVNNPDNFSLRVLDLDLTVSMRGEGYPTIKSLHTAKAEFSGVSYNFPGRSISLKGIIFDGNVSDDPNSWDSLNFDSFTGSQALTVGGLFRFSIKDCEFNNSAGRGLYMEDCLFGIVENCHANKMRNDKGDGFYILDTHDVEVISCTARDHTRIGFVCETGTYNIDFNRCWADNGHDQSKDYGGGEFNVGFWAENSTDITYSKCTASNQWETGFLTSTTSNLANLPFDRSVCTFTITGCVAMKIGQSAPFGRIGFSNSALVAANSIVTTVGCYVFEAGTCFRSVVFAGSVKSIHDYTDCHGYSTGATNLSMPFLADTVVNDMLDFTMTNCTGGFDDYTFANDDLAPSADIGSFDPFRYKLTVNGYTNHQGPAIFKNISGVRELEQYYNRVNGRFKFSNAAKKLTIENSTMTGASGAGDINVNPDAEVYLDNVDIVGSFIIGEMRLRGNCRLIGGTLRHFFENAVADGRPLMECRIDIENDIFAISAPTETPIFIEYRDADFGPAIISGVWRNTGAAVTGNKGFIELSQPGNDTFANTLMIDDTVEFEISRVNIPGAPANYAAGAQRIIMHRP